MVYKVGAIVLVAMIVLAMIGLRVHTKVSVQRTFNAPVDKLWQIWTDAETIKKWWGPNGYKAPAIRNDFRVGESYLWAMESPKGEVFRNTGTYKEIVSKKRIVSTMSFADKDGNPIPGSQAPVPGSWPDEITVIVEFNESNGRTEVRVSELGIPVIGKIFARIGWAQQFDKIELLL
jgi:uncharacterized protein YndB with AHSA1/START domain